MGFLEDFLAGAAQQGTKEIGNFNQRQEQQRREGVAQERFDQQQAAQNKRFEAQQRQAEKALAASNNKADRALKGNVFNNILRQAKDPLTGEINQQSFDNAMSQAVRLGFFEPEEAINLQESFEPPIEQEEQVPEVLPVSDANPFLDNIRNSRGARALEQLFPKQTPSVRQQLGIPKGAAPSVSTRSLVSPDSPGASFIDSLFGQGSKNPILPGAAPAQPQAPIASNIPTEEDELDALLNELQ